MGSDNLHELRSKQRSQRVAREMKIRSQTWLFACEGKRTEPDYFTALINYANTKSDRKIKFKVEGLGKNTETLVNSVDDFYNFAVIAQFVCPQLAQMPCREQLNIMLRESRLKSRITAL